MKGIFRGVSEDGTYIVQLSDGSGIVKGVIPLHGYAHPSDHHGSRTFPEPGSMCIVEEMDSELFCLGFYMPHTSDGVRHTVSDGGAGSQEIVGRLGNFVRIAGNGISSLGSSPVAQILTVPTANLVRIVSSSFQILSSIGQVNLNTSKKSLFTATIGSPKDSKSSKKPLESHSLRTLYLYPPPGYPEWQINPRWS